jgi:exopolysaccharide biosynthesis protein
MKKLFILILIIFSLFPWSSYAASLGKQLSGKILLNVEGKGEAWYVNPANSKRYYLGRPTDAFRVMRELGVGIKNEKLALIQPADANLKIVLASEHVASSSLSGTAIFQNATSSAKILGNGSYDIGLSRQVSGKILLQVEENGEAWYVNPKDLKRYFLGKPDDAFRVMRDLSLGISGENLAKVHKPGSSESIDQYSRYEHKKLQTLDGEFTVDIVEIDLKNPKLKIVTDTQYPEPSHALKGTMKFGATSLANFVLRNKGFAGMNGSYFCSSSGCGGANYYFFPVYNTRSGKLINADELKYWTTGPIIAFDENNKFYYFKDSREFKSVADFEKTYGVKLQAAIGNKPRLIQDYMNYLIEWEMDEKQMTQKSSKNAIGYKDNKIYLVVAYGATVPNLANVMKAIGVEYALNIDGGYSTALFYNDEYMSGPGRNIPNAIIFAEQDK